MGQKRHRDRKGLAGAGIATEHGKGGLANPRPGQAQLTKGLQTGPVSWPAVEAQTAAGPRPAAPSTDPKPLNRWEKPAPAPGDLGQGGAGQGQATEGAIGRTDSGLAGRATSKGRVWPKGFLEEAPDCRKGREREACFRIRSGPSWVCFGKVFLLV